MIYYRSILSHQGKNVKQKLHLIHCYYWHFGLQQQELDNDGASNLISYLEGTFTTEKLIERSGQKYERVVCWERVGNFYKNLQRYYEAIAIYASLYERLLLAQQKNGKWIKKSNALVWMSDCYADIGFSVISKRYLMYTLCENAIEEKGELKPNDSGAYWRLIARGMSEEQIRKYLKEAYCLWEKNQEKAMFPEWIAQKLSDKSWATEVASPQELGVYIVNREYIGQLRNSLGDGSGKNFEFLAEYLLSSMPGCRVIKKSMKSNSTDYDVVCSIEGHAVDFRSEFGRYFVCECKDWKDPADVTVILKFCRVLDSIKARFGILFSKNGISGHDRDRDAEREIYKMYQDRGVVIVVVDEKDIDEVIKGANFITLLKEKYERIRLDLPSK